MSPALIRVLCVDDHPIVREGLKLIIDREADMQVVATAADGAEAVSAYDEAQPDVTLMDLQLPRMNGVDAIRRIREADDGARIVVLTMYGGDGDIHRALNAGAVTYVLKDTLSHDLVNVIREVYDGGRPLDPELRTRLDAHAGEPRLTDRELDVLALIARGCRNRAIAVELAISEDTVHAHVKRILTKLDVRDRTEAVFVASRRGIIHPEHPQFGLWDRMKRNLQR